MSELSSEILARKFIFKDGNSYIEKLYKDDELHERQSLIIEHNNFFLSIFGQNPKIFIEDWIKDRPFKKYVFKRNCNPIQMAVQEQKSTNVNTTDGINNVRHNQTKASSIIDIHLWSNARWKGFGFLSSPGMPLGIFLAYENESFAKKIFEGWIKRFGKIDQHEEINISIIKGVNRENPYWYRVHISKNFENKMLKSGLFITSTTRFHEIHATNPNNLTNLINAFNYQKKFVLLPTLLKPDGTYELYSDLGILKKKLIIKDAWEIGEHDPDSVVILKDDKPMIPFDKPDAPIFNLLKLKNN